MGIFDGTKRAFGDLGPLSDRELDEQHEALRQRYVSGEAHLYNELHRYNAEIADRMNNAYIRENPEPQELRHREHGWHLPNDD
ncbi:hypothetical protein PV772_19215 [Pseudarthrobacter sp. CC12]|uniref:hypothetical protein n=1 Tax=Pseudarthrobacter sp. CC12 TaxID=3029193 RepID=UPI003266556D